jgi:hypothetical protein
VDLIPFIIVDDFFENPDQIRKEALKAEYRGGSNFPGKRASCSEYINVLTARKIFSLLVDMNKHVVEGSLDISFQLVTEAMGEGWVHSDAGIVYFAGVIYLTPNAPIDGGTSLYKKHKNIDEAVDDHGRIKEDFYTNKIKESDIKITRKNNNEFFYKTLEVKNVYNRLIMYPGNEFHAANKFFGSTLEDSRLTIVFFVTHIASNTILPIERMKLAEKK